MKNITLLLLLFTVLLSCNNQKEISKISTESSFTAVKNDSTWKATTTYANYSKKDSMFTLTGSKRDAKYYQDEQLQLTFNISDISKSNTITNSFSKWDFIIGGDAVADTYTSENSSINSIRITSLDTVNKYIQGIFDLELIRTKRLSDLGEKMIFKKGNFTLKYETIE